MKKMYLENQDQEGFEDRMDDEDEIEEEIVPINLHCGTHFDHNDKSGATGTLVS